MGNEAVILNCLKIDFRRELQSLAVTTSLPSFDEKVLLLTGYGCSRADAHHGLRAQKLPAALRSQSPWGACRPDRAILFPHSPPVRKYIVGIRAGLNLGEFPTRTANARLACDSLEDYHGTEFFRMLSRITLTKDVIGPWIWG